MLLLISMSQNFKTEKDPWKNVSEFTGSPQVFSSNIHCKPALHIYCQKPDSVANRYYTGLTISPSDFTPSKLTFSQYCKP